MKIQNANNYEMMSIQGAEVMLKLMRNKSNAIICLATGSSPQRMYEIVAQRIGEEMIDISNMTFVKLDEWYGVDPQDDCTCTTFIKTKFLDKLPQKPKALIEMKSNGDVLEETKAMDAFLQHHQIDLMILGLGMDAHLGLNEPDEYLRLHCHQAILHEKTKGHDMAKGKHVTSGLTIGMEGIFQSKQILMLVCGDKKTDAYHMFMSKQITTKAPCSFLWLHQNCVTIIDRNQFPDRK